MYELLEKLLITGYFIDHVNISKNEISLTFNTVNVNNDIFSISLGIPYDYLENIIKIIGDKQYYLFTRNEEIILTIKNEHKVSVMG